MSFTIKGNFAANGSSAEFTARKYVIHLGTDTNANFGSGTVTLKSKSHPQLDFTTQASYTAAAVITQPADFIGATTFKLVLASSTNPNIDYSITFE